jgi:hypothetical protein
VRLKIIYYICNKIYEEMKSTLLLGMMSIVSALLLGMMSIVSANVCTDPATTRETFIESQCCSRMCGEVCASDAGCISGKCLEKCCTFNDVNCAVCIDDGSCGTCNAGFSIKSAFSAGTFESQAVDENSKRIAFSSNSKVIAVDIGFKVSVKELDASTNTWQQKGQNITVSSLTYVELNKDGTVLAIGEPFSSMRKGRIRVLDWTGTAWEQRGLDIMGASAQDQFGRALSFSADGNILAVGGRHTDVDVSDTTDDSGRVSVFEWNGAAWIPKGSNIDGEHKKHFLGLDVSLSDDGTKLALISGMRYSNYGVSDSEFNDHVYVYSFINNDWGNMKKKALAYTQSVDMSGDGSRFIVGRAERDTAEVFGFDADGNIEQIGVNLNTYLADHAESELGYYVGLNYDGSAAVVGAQKAGTDNKGVVLVLDLDGGSWRKRSEIIGASAGDQIGGDVFISDDGFYIAFRASYNNKESFIYEWNSSCPDSATECCVADQ